MGPQDSSADCRVGALLGLASGSIFALLLLALEGGFQRYAGVPTQATTTGWLTGLGSYLVPTCGLGLFFALALAWRGVVDRIFLRVLFGLFLLFVVSVGILEGVERTRLRDLPGVSWAVPFSIPIAVGLITLVWIRGMHGRLPLAERWPAWAVHGLILASISSFTLVFQAHTQLFADPLAPESLIGTAWIIGGSFAVAFPLSLIAFAVGGALRVRVSGLAESHVAASVRHALVLTTIVVVSLVIVAFVGLTGPGDGTAGAKRPPRGVVLVMADTLRADALGGYQGGVGLSDTPSIDRIAARGVLFEQCTSASNWTLPSFASIFTSRVPSDHGAGTNPGNGTEFAPLRPDVPTLAEFLSSRGVRTHALVNNTYLHPAFGLDRGFDDYRMMRPAPDNRILPRIWYRLYAPPTLPYAEADRVVGEFREALDRVTADGDPFFLVVQLMDAHAPYLDRESGEVFADRGERLHTPEGLAAARRAYRSEVRHLDRSFGEMAREIDRHGLGRSVLLIFAGDHGEEFMEHGGTGHGRTMYQESVHVPLLMTGAGIPREARRSAEPVGLVDLMPTILDWWGMESPAGIVGRSLLPLVSDAPPAIGSGRAFLAEACYQRERKMVRIGAMKLIRGPIGAEAPLELYDLANDPGEHTNLAVERPSEVDRLRRRFDREAARGASDPVSAPHPPVSGHDLLDQDARERLRALGYLAPEHP